jgi:nucleotide-binding universal stress UspA family protein
MTNAPIELSSKYARTSMLLTKFCQSTSLIVVGRRGRSEITELVLGSVSSYIVHASHKSVLVVQN